MVTRCAWAIKDSKVVKRWFPFVWSSGFSVVQKQKNIHALHNSILFDCPEEIPLEISTKGEVDAGKNLSAFILKLDTFPVECHFQSCKVFEKGGPYKDLLYTDGKTAKTDERIRNSGDLLYFERDGVKWPSEPKSAFYDFLYITALRQTYGDHYDLSGYTWFTDIEFNPSRSINCQARAVAIYKLLQQLKAFACMNSMETWIAFHKVFVLG